MKRLLWLSLLLPAAAMAQPVDDEITYHYLEIGYLLTEREVPGPDLDGRGPGRLEYSFEIRDHLHLFASAAAVDYKDVDARARTKTFGIGAHFNISERLSFFGRVAYTDVDLNLGLGTESDDGGIASIGLRLRPAAGYEIRVGGSHRELDTAGGDSSFFAAGDIFLTDIVALTIELNVGDDETSALVGGRFYFGKPDRSGPRRRW